MSKITTFYQNFKKLFKSSKPQIEEKSVENSEKIVPFSVQATHNLPEYSPLSQYAQLEQYKSWVYAAINKRAQCISELDLVLYKKLRNRGRETFKEIKEHPVLDLLDRVNKIQTFPDLIEYTQIYKDLTGEAFWWLVQNEKGEILEIYPFLRPDYMQILTSAKDFIAGYIYSVPGSGEQITFHPNEIIHFKYANPLNPYRGYSPIKAVEIEISTYTEASKWNWRFFKNNAKPFGVITVDGVISEEQMNRIKTQWDQKHRSEENAFRLAILGNGAKYEDHGFTQKDMDFGVLKNMSRDEILAVYQVPLSVINPNESINRATADTAKDLFYENTIIPLMRKIILTLNEFLLPHYKDDSLFFSFTNSAPKNKEEDLKIYANGLQYGWLSPNEIRELEGKEPFEGGDRFFMPFNVQSIGSFSSSEKKYKPQIKFRHRTDTEINQENINKIVKDKLSKILNSKIIKKKLDDEKEFERIGLLFWTRKQNIIKGDEQKLKDKLRIHFVRQANQVLKSIKSIGEINFNLLEEIELIKKDLSPLMKEILKKIYLDTLKTINYQGVIRIPYLEEYIDDYGIKYITTINKTTEQKIDELYLAGEENDLDPSEIKKEIKTFFENTIIERASIITRTELQRMLNWSSNQAYKDSGVVNAKKWWTALDERVCEACDALHGKIIDIESNFFDKGTNFMGLDLDYADVAAPPLHVNCRCTNIPITIPIDQQE